MKTRAIDRVVHTRMGNVDYNSHVGSGTNWYDLDIANNDDDFTFTGFGANDPKGKRRFTAGTYQIDQHDRKVVGDYWTAYRDWNPYNWWTGTPAHWGSWTAFLNEGVMNPWGNNYWGATLNPYNETRLQIVSYNNALSDLYEGLKATSMNLALTIGERRESAKMLRKAFSAMGSILTTARKVRRDLLHNPSLLASNLWLQAKYGWLPMYSDVHAALNFHFHLFSEMEFKGYSSRKVDGKDSDLIHYLYFPYRQYHTRKHHSKCLFIVRAGIADSDAYNLSRITSLNPVSIAWELVPFSFVFDWFVDVGGYLANMEASLGAGLSFKSGMVTELNIMEHEVQCIYPFTKTLGPYNIYGSRRESEFAYQHFGKRRKVTKARSILGSFPRPRIPAFRPNLGSQRIVSFAALLRQVLLGKVRH